MADHLIVDISRFLCEYSDSCVQFLINGSGAAALANELKSDKPPQVG